MSSWPARTFLAAVLLAAAPAAAQPADDVARARQLFVEGAKLADGGKWEAARDAFERSLKLKRAAITLYNLGVAQQETGRIAGAIESFRAFLAMPVEPATQRYVEPVRAVLPKLEARVARIELSVRPADLRGVAVRIDGRDVAPEPGGWMVDPGSHEVIAVAPGVAELHQTFTLPEGGKTAITLSPPTTSGIFASMSTAVPASLGIAGAALFLAGEITFTAGAARGSSDSSGRSMMAAGNVIAGAGIAAAGIGLVLLLKRPTQVDTARVAPWFAGSVGGVEVRF
jgi:hypothetical protein